MVIRIFSRAESPANPPVVQLAHDRRGHLCDIARSHVRFLWKSGRAVDIAAMTEFDLDRTQTGLAGCAIAPIPPDAASPIRYLTIRVWLAGIECNSIS